MSCLELMARESALKRIERYISQGILHAYRAGVAIQSGGMLPVLERASTRLKDPDDDLTDVNLSAKQFCDIATNQGREALFQSIQQNGGFSPVRLFDGEKIQHLFLKNPKVPDIERAASVFLAALFAHDLWTSSQLI